MEQSADSWRVSGAAKDGVSGSNPSGAIMRDGPMEVNNGGRRSSDGGPPPFNRTRSFKKQLVRSQAIRESQSPPRIPSPRPPGLIESRERIKIQPSVKKKSASFDLDDRPALNPDGYDHHSPLDIGNSVNPNMISVSGQNNVEIKSLCKVPEKLGANSSSVYNQPTSKIFGSESNDFSGKFCNNSSKLDSVKSSYKDNGKHENSTCNTMINFDRITNILGVVDKDKMFCGVSECKTNENVVYLNCEDIEGGMMDSNRHTRNGNDQINNKFSNYNNNNVQRNNMNLEGASVDVTEDCDDEEDSGENDYDSFADEDSRRCRSKFEATASQVKFSERVRERNTSKDRSPAGRNCSKVEFQQVEIQVTSGDCDSRQKLNEEIVNEGSHHHRRRAFRISNSGSTGGSQGSRRCDCRSIEIDEEMELKEEADSINEGGVRRANCPSKQDSGVCCWDSCTCSSCYWAGDVSPEVGASFSDTEEDTIRPRRQRTICEDDNQFNQSMDTCRCPDKSDRWSGRRSGSTLTVQRASSGGNPRLLRKQSSGGSVDSGQHSITSPFLSRDNSTELPGPYDIQEQYSFIKDILNKNHKDRMTLLKIEKELVALVRDSTRKEHKIPTQSSYIRLLIHRCSDVFGLKHNVDPTYKNAVYISKPATGHIACRVPPICPFIQWCTVKFETSPTGDIEVPTSPAKSILKRDTQSLDEDAATPRPPARQMMLQPPRSKSFEQREEEYEKARKRIFSSTGRGGNESHWDWDGSMRPQDHDIDNVRVPRLIAPEHVTRQTRLLKVQSLEHRDALPTSAGARGAVSKAHSFGGYGGKPQGIQRGDSVTSTSSAPPHRILSRQGELASNSWRISPGSSGYKTHSARSDSITPSPTPITGNSSSHTATATSGVCFTGDAVVSNSGTNTASGLLWAITDMSTVPTGALIIHPQTGQALTNRDGSLYHYDPARPPQTAMLPRSQVNLEGVRVLSNPERRRSRLEKQRATLSPGNEADLTNSDKEALEECGENSDDTIRGSITSDPPNDASSPNPTKFQPETNDQENKSKSCLCQGCLQIDPVPNSDTSKHRPQISPTGVQSNKPTVDSPRKNSPKHKNNETKKESDVTKDNATIVVNENANSSQQKRLAAECVNKSKPSLPNQDGSIKNRAEVNTSFNYNTKIQLNDNKVDPVKIRDQGRKIEDQNTLIEKAFFNTYAPIPHDKPQEYAHPVHNLDEVYCPEGCKEEKSMLGYETRSPDVSRPENFILAPYTDMVHGGAFFGLGQQPGVPIGQQQFYDPGNVYHDPRNPELQAFVHPLGYKPHTPQQHGQIAYLPQQEPVNAPYPEHLPYAGPMVHQPYRLQDPQDHLQYPALNRTPTTPHRQQIVLPKPPQLASSPGIISDHHETPNQLYHHQEVPIQTCFATREQVAQQVAQQVAAGTAQVRRMAAPQITYQVTGSPSWGCWPQLALYGSPTHQPEDISQHKISPHPAATYHLHDAASMPPVPQTFYQHPQNLVQTQTSPYFPYGATHQSHPMPYPINPQQYPQMFQPTYRPDVCLQQGFIERPPDSRGSANSGSSRATPLPSYPPADNVPFGNIDANFVGSFPYVQQLYPTYQYAYNQIPQANMIYDQNYENQNVNLNIALKNNLIDYSINSPQHQQRNLYKGPTHRNIMSPKESFIDRSITPRALAAKLLHDVLTNSQELPPNIPAETEVQNKSIRDRRRGFRNASSLSILSKQNSFEIDEGTDSKIKTQYYSSTSSDITVPNKTDHRNTEVPENKSNKSDNQKVLNEKVLTSNLSNEAKAFVPKNEQNETKVPGAIDNNLTSWDSDKAIETNSKPIDDTARLSGGGIASDSKKQSQQNFGAKGYHNFPKYLNKSRQNSNERFGGRGRENRLVGQASVDSGLQRVRQSSMGETPRSPLQASPILAWPTPGSPSNSNPCPRQTSRGGSTSGSPTPSSFALPNLSRPPPTGGTTSQPHKQSQSPLASHQPNSDAGRPPRNIDSRQSPNVARHFKQNHQSQYPDRINSVGGSYPQSNQNQRTHNIVQPLNSGGRGLIQTPPPSAIHTLLQHSHQPVHHPAYIFRQVPRWLRTNSGPGLLAPTPPFASQSRMRFPRPPNQTQTPHFYR